MADSKKHGHRTDKAHGHEREYDQSREKHHNMDISALEDHRIDRGREKERSHVESDIRAERRGNKKNSRGKE